MVMTAPNPLAPGFPRTWPDCLPAMEAIARHLLALGAEDEEAMLCLMMDFPSLPEVAGPAWRSDAYYANLVARERRTLAAHPELAEQQRDEPTSYELQVVHAAVDLVRLCQRYGITISLCAIPGNLQLSRKVMVEGAVWMAIRQHKTELLGLLRQPRMAIVASVAP
jgi:hypothetical protein